MTDRFRASWRPLLLAALPLALAGGLVVRGRTPRPPARAGAPAEARGSFRVRYGAAAAEDTRAWRDRLRADSVLERAAARLNAFVQLPTDVVLSFEECGDDDAFYEKRRVTFCYEEVADYGDLLAPHRLGEAETRRVEGAASFFLYHEAGHALVDVLRLPVTGKEEDAVDQFAVYFLAEGPPPDVRGDALRAAEVLGRLAHAEESRSGAVPVWDVHSLDGQRQANLLCWLYGADPRAFRRAVRHAGLPEERRSSCEDEYEQMAGSWEALLEPYLAHGGPMTSPPFPAGPALRSSGRYRP